MTDVKKCPRCLGVMSEYPAVSRRDNKTEICSDCCQEEAMIDYGRNSLPDPLKRELVFLTALARFK